LFMDQFAETWHLYGLPWWLRGRSVCLQCRRPGFDLYNISIPTHELEYLHDHISRIRGETEEDGRGVR